MYIDEFIELAEHWEGLGWAVQAQVHDLLSHEFEYGSLNENAVNLIAQFADTLYANYGIDTNELHAAIDEYEALEPEEDD